MSGDPQNQCGAPLYRSSCPWDCASGGATRFPPFLGLLVGCGGPHVILRYKNGAHEPRPRLACVPGQLFEDIV